MICLNVLEIEWSFVFKIVFNFLLNGGYLHGFLWAGWFLDIDCLTHRNEPWILREYQSYYRGETEFLSQNSSRTSQQIVIKHFSSPFQHNPIFQISIFLPPFKFNLFTYIQRLPNSHAEKASAFSIFFILFPYRWHFQKNKCNGKIK